VKEMEALFVELSDEYGEYQYSLTWEKQRIVSELHGGIIEIDHPSKDQFEYEGYKFWWYHAENQRHPDTPVVVVSWTSNYREDSWDENEEQIDATPEDIAAFIRGREEGYESDAGTPDRLEEIG
jgi:hypothetical protein